MVVQNLIVYHHSIPYPMIASDTWIVPNVSGTAPKPRSSDHSAAFVNKLLYIFGRCGKDNEEYNDLYTLDTGDVLIFFLKLGTQPEPAHLNDTPDVPLQVRRFFLVVVLRRR